MKILQKNREIRALTPAEYEKKFQIPYLPHLQFQNGEEKRRMGRLCPYLLRGSWMREEPKELLDGTVAPTLIGWISDEVGYGLFAAKDFEEGEWIGEYTGRVRPYYRLHPDTNSYCLHYPTRFWSWSYWMVDALFGGNETRFINDTGDPNLEFRCLVDRDRILHMVLYTRCPVIKGEELTVSYGSDYWRYRKKQDSSN